MDDAAVARALRQLCPTIDLSESALVAGGKILKEQLRSIIKTARVMARHSKRVSVQTDDVNRALSVLGHEVVYGSQRFHNQRLLSVDGRDVFFAEDPDISTAEVNTIILDRPPVEVSIHSHWLAIEGTQPRVPENQPPEMKIPKDKTHRGILPKETGRKRKSHTDTVHTVRGGMIQGDIELRLPVEHALTVEQQAYFEQIRENIESVTSEGKDIPTDQLEKRINDLQFDAALQPLVPYLLRFVSRHVYLSQQNDRILQLLLKILHSLVRNKHLDLGLYSHHIFPLILSCLLSEDIEGTTTEHLNAAYRVRDAAAAVLASAVDVFDDSVSNVHCRISQRLTDDLDPETHPLLKYGAIRGLDAMGVTRVEAVQQLLSMCFNHLRSQQDNSHPTSLEHQQKEKCIALIEEIMERSVKESDQSGNQFLSPLEKRARRDDAFL